MMKKDHDNSLKNLILIVCIVLILLFSNPISLPFLFRSKTGGHLNAFAFMIVIIWNSVLVWLCCLLYKHKKTFSLKNIWREAVLLSFSLLLSLCVAEWFIRIWIHKYAPGDIKSALIGWGHNELRPEESKLRPYIYLNYGLNPPYKNKNNVLQHNSFGFRGKEFPIVKPIGTFRIVCIGGSTTYTTGVEDWEQSYPAQLEQCLKKEYGFSNVEVINAGVPAYSTWESLINFQFKILDINPDMVIVYHAVNDVTARLVEPYAYRGDNSGWRRPWGLQQSFFEKSMLFRLLNYKFHFTVSSPAGLDRFILAGTAINRDADMAQALKQNQPIYFLRNLKNIAAIAKENNIQLVLCTFAFSQSLIPDRIKYYAEGIKEHNTILRSLSQDKNLPLIDLYNIIPDDHNYWVDFMHVNEAGAFLQAKAMADYLRNNNLIH